MVGFRRIISYNKKVAGSPPQRLAKPIRKWYGQVLLSFCKGEFDGYDDPKDVIIEQMIQTFKLSTNELLICNEMSINGLITEHRGYQTKLRDFKKSVSDHCLEMGYK